MGLEEAAAVRGTEIGAPGLALRKAQREAKERQEARIEKSALFCMHAALRLGRPILEPRLPRSPFRLRAYLGSRINHEPASPYALIHFRRVRRLLPAILPQASDRAGF